MLLGPTTKAVLGTAEGSEHEDVVGAAEVDSSVVLVADLVSDKASEVVVTGSAAFVSDSEVVFFESDVVVADSEVSEEASEVVGAAEVVVSTSCLKSLALLA